METEECDLVEHLIDFTEAAASDSAILKEAMSQIREEDEDEEERPSKSRRATESVKESSQRHVKHPKPSLYVTILNHLGMHLAFKESTVADVCSQKRVHALEVRFQSIHALKGTRGVFLQERIPSSPEAHVRWGGTKRSFVSVVTHPQHP